MGTKNSSTVRAFAAVGAAALALVGLAGSADAATARAAAARPDLVVSSLKWAPLSPAAGQQLRFNAVITNQGTAATPAGTISGVAFEVDGRKRTWSDTTTTAIQPGQSVLVTANGGPTGSATWTTTAGSHTLRAVVDDVARIPESNEGNNTRNATVTVASGLSVRPGGAGLLVGFANLNRPTVLTTNITGDLYAGCFDQQDVLVDGTEQFVGAWTIGRNTPNYGGKFFDGEVMLSAVQTQQTVGADLQEVYYSYQGHSPVPCATGQTARFTGFHASSITLTRWPGKFGSEGPALARVQQDVDLVLPV
ncbi:Ig-like domain-containing protein [Kineococcus sp. NBC_00420]|uniref:CARDB domain-containing protein n=1 Tax=Kineococcus sp. NBC_00420 TaxID=2903564 RepID=UPI002E1DC10D